MSFNIDMNINIIKDNYSATISTHGAELIELKKDNKNILWNRDTKYWGDSALVLFPFIGRNYNDTYTYNNKEYHIGIHGFGPKSEFTIIDKKDDSVMLVLTDSEETYEVYPFNFDFVVQYTLTNKGLNVTYIIVNKSNKEMYFTTGYHPGFMLDKPLESYKINFPNADKPEEVCIVTKCMLTGEIKPIVLKNKTLSLSKDLFVNSARILKGVGNKAILLDDEDNKIVELEYENFENIVLWQTLNSDAPFICIEGWRGLPGKFEHIDEITEIEDKTKLKQNDSYILNAYINF